MNVTDKNKKMFLAGACVVVLGFTALIVWLIFSNNRATTTAMEAEARADSLAIANDQLVLTNEFNQLNADFNQYEGQQKYLKNDSLVQKYNEARLKVEGLIKELNNEKSKNAKNMANSRAKIKQLEGEIATLKGIVRHYLEEIKRLGEENAGLKKEIQAVQQKNEQLNTQYTEASSRNAQLSETVQLAKKLNITGLSFAAYNRKGKNEKNITKATQLGAHFTVTPNNTAAPGMKEFYLRILSPEGSLLGSGGSFQMDGRSIPCTAKRSVEYNNDETSVAIYWDVNTTLTPGDYTVEVFCDGYRLGSRHFTMQK